VLFKISDFYWDDGCERTSLHQNGLTFLSKIIRGDEMWVYSSQWKSPSYLCPKKAMQYHSNAKSMFIFFYTDGMVHHEFVPHGQTVIQDFYKGILQRYFSTFLVLWTPSLK
jgi:hypothetical protein